VTVPEKGVERKIKEPGRVQLGRERSKVIGGRKASEELRGGLRLGSRHGKAEQLSERTATTSAYTRPTPVLTSTLLIQKARSDGKPYSRAEENHLEQDTPEELGGPRSDEVVLVDLEGVVLRIVGDGLDVVGGAAGVLVVEVLVLLDRVELDASDFVSRVGWDV
jgi:hypothetical protein